MFGILIIKTSQSRQNLKPLHENTEANCSVDTAVFLTLKKHANGMAIICFVSHSISSTDYT